MSDCRAKTRTVLYVITSIFFSIQLTKRWWLYSGAHSLLEGASEVFLHQKRLTLTLTLMVHLKTKQNNISLSIIIFRDIKMKLEVIQPTVQSLVRLNGCAGWPGSMMVAKPNKRTLNLCGTNFGLFPFDCQSMNYFPLIVKA